jgi:Big-like domain-containing protein
MRTLFRLVVALNVLLFSFAALANDVTISGTTTFGALDGGADDEDHVANGVFTVTGNLIINGTINCNDDGPGANSACPMSFSVGNNLVLNTGSAVFAENRTKAGNGGNITFTVGGDVILHGATVSLPGALISSAKTNSGNPAHGGDITITVAGAFTQESGSIVSSGASDANAGAIAMSSGGPAAVGGYIFAGPSRTLSASIYTDDILSTGGGHVVGGAITITSLTHTEPAVVIGPQAVIASQGHDGGGNTVAINGCNVQVNGLVGALIHKSTTPSRVVIRSGTTLTVDGSHLDGSGSSHLGRIRADATGDSAADNRADLFAANDIIVAGPPAASTQFTVTANPGEKGDGGTINVISTAATVTASGNAFASTGSNKDQKGGAVNVSSKGNVTLSSATLEFSGGDNGSDRAGGHIAVRSYSAAVNWTSGVGDVRPVGSSAGVPAAQQGTISLTYCTTLSTSGTSFPSNGSPVGVFPTTTQTCSPATPSLPAGETLPVCNNPPVANDTSATTFEDHAVTVTMTASDADGDSLTFSIVSNPAHGSLSAIFNPTPTSAQVTYTPGSNYNGNDSFTFKADDGKGGTSIGTVTITITPVNDPPSFTLGANPVSSLEDAGPQSVAGYASNISAGPTADEASQTVTFTVNNDNNALFSAQPAISSNGTLTYTAAPNANGSANVTVVAHDDGGTANGGSDTSATQNFNLFVTAVNDGPSFTKGADQTVNEDAGAQSVANWATAISAGPANESGQTVTFNVANDNNALFSAQPAVASNGTLTYTPAPNANGVATVTVTAHDDGGTANGGVDTSAPQTFPITVTSVNDAPSFTSGGNVSVNEDSGAYSAVWATNISAGPPNESGQSVTFNVANDNNTLFSAQPSVAPNGTLTFTPAPDANGMATVTISAHDDGGTANGGVDSSAPQTFTLTVVAVNDAPSFTKGPDESVLSDAGPQSYPNWATNISAGPANESAQTVAFLVSNDNNAAFSSQPMISSTGTLTFSAAVTAPTTTVHVSVAAHDNGGTANGGVDTSAAQTFNINITHANQPPTAVNDSFDAVGNTELAAGTAGTQAATLTASGSLLANDSDSDGDPIVAALGSASAGANVVVHSDGTFTYLPPVGFSGDDTFTYTVSDDHGHTVTGTVTIHVIKRILYVKNNGGGTTGRVDSPFTTLAAAQAAAMDNDTVYVFTGDGTTSGQSNGFVISHNGERLIGEGVALKAAGVYNGSTDPQLRAAGSRARIANAAGDAVSIAGAGTLSNNEVSGIEISSALLAGVNISNVANLRMDSDAVVSSTHSGVSGASVNGFSFTNGSVAASGNASGDANVAFTNLTGSATISDSTFSGAYGDNIRVANTTGSLNRLTLNNINLNGNSTTTGNNAVQLTAGNGTTMNVTVTGSHFTNTRAQHFQLSLSGSATSDLVFTGNVISNAQTALSGGGAVVVATGGGGNPALTYNISNNTIRDAVGTALNIAKGVGTGTASGTVDNNTIGVPTVANSGSSQGSGISIVHIGGGTSTTTVTNNHVAQYNNTGITVQIGDAASGGNGTINARVTGNTVSNPGSLASNGFLLNAGTVTGDSHFVCLTLGGAGSAANSVTGSSANGATDIRLRQRQATTVRLAGYAGANNDNAAVQSYVQSQNGGTPTVSAANTVPTGGGFIGGTCP